MKGTVWQHRKGGTYTVIGVAKGCEKNKQGIEGVDMVVYQANDVERRLYVRAKSEFLDGRFGLVFNGPDGLSVEDRAQMEQRKETPGKNGKKDKKGQKDADLPPKEDPVEAPLRCLAVDVAYDDKAGSARVAGVVFEWYDAEAPLESIVFDRVGVEPYQTGAFYKRELPCILDLLDRLTVRPDVIFVDGYVDLGGESPGLGRALFDALGGKIKVIGVAKSPFSFAPHIEAWRNSTTRPLWVTAAGMPPREAALAVQKMHGPYRLPTLLKAVDTLSRSSGFPPFGNYGNT